MRTALGGAIMMEKPNIKVPPSLPLPPGPGRGLGPGRDTGDLFGGQPFHQTAGGLGIGACLRLRDVAGLQWLNLELCVSGSGMRLRQ
jgi:hypothetical protein